MAVAVALLAMLLALLPLPSLLLALLPLLSSLFLDSQLPCAARTDLAAALAAARFAASARSGLAAARFAASERTDIAAA